MSDDKKQRFLPGSLGEALAKELGDERRAAQFCAKHGYEPNAVTPFTIAAKEDLSEKPPAELWSERDRSNGEGPFDFIARVYAEQIEGGVMSRAILHKHDRPLYNYHAQLIKRRGSDPLNLPKNVDVTTKRLEQADPIMMRHYARLNGRSMSRRNQL